MSVHNFGFCTAVCLSNPSNVSLLLCHSLATEPSYNQ